MTFNFQEIDTEALRILNLCYERAKEVIHKSYDFLREALCCYIFVPIAV